MTIQRQYTLPNCNLVLEGLSTQEESPSAPMTVLMNVECHFPGTQGSPLSGGREFLEQLAGAVNLYAQQLLSGVSLPDKDKTPAPVEMKPGEGTHHHLIVRSQAQAMSDDRMEEAVPRDIRLTTVQFFDLVDALDQLVSDGNTLPDLTLPLQPIPRRHVKPEEPVTKRVAPAAIGASALAAAAVALFFVPLPELEPSRSSDPSSSAAEETVETPVEESDPPQAPEELTPTPTPDAAAGAAALDRLADAPALDAATRAALQTQVQARLQAAWEPEALPSEPLGYRIAVSSEGDILGFKYGSDAALSYADETPLPALTYVPAEPSEPALEPVAQFQVLFNPNGDVGVRQLQGEADTRESSSPAMVGDMDASIDTPIDTFEQVRQLNQSLRDDLAIAWQDPNLEADAIYRVRLNADGDILGYEAIDAGVEGALPLADLVNDAASAGPQADFRVVFTEDGVVEVSPWDGWPD